MSGPVTNEQKYDVSKEADTLALLRYIHQLPERGSIKHQVRDLIFAYRQTPSAESFAGLKATAAELGLTVTTSRSKDMMTPQSPTARSRSRLGLSRPRPSFSFRPRKTLRPAEPAAASQSAAAESPSTSKKDKAPTSMPAETDSEAPLSSPKLELPTEEVIPAVKKTSPTPPAPNTQAHGSAVPSSTPPPANADRIREIKSAVNQKVGNPTHLVAINNEIGREYMAALLEAMKKQNGGLAGEFEIAMARLEKAFAAVSKLLLETPLPAEAKTTKNTEETKTQAESASAEETISATPIDDTRQAELSTQAPETKSAECPSGISTAPNPAKPWQLRSLAEEIRLKPTTRASSSPSPQKQQPQTSVPSPKRQETSPAADSANVPVPPASPSVPSRSPASPMTEIKSPPRPTLTSVAHDRVAGKALGQKIEQESEAAAIERKLAESKTDPLLLPEVTEGLEQLLSEWELFQSKGFFKLGPSGVDHPLYKRLASLPMQAVAAGRFEGVTPEIRLNLSDYMNGWRYEEGIVYDPGESFERYLRRVVRRVLDSHQKLAAARKS